MARAIIRNITGAGAIPEPEWVDWSIPGLEGASKHTGDPDQYGWTYTFTSTTQCPKIQEGCFAQVSWGYINENTGRLYISTDAGATWTLIGSKALGSSGTITASLNNYVGKRALFRMQVQVTSGSWGYNIAISSAKVKQ